jgi:hypothetical protein
MRRLGLGTILLGFAGLAQAAVYAPTRFDDPAPDGCLPADCSLREAVIAADATLAGDVIQLAQGDYLLERVCGTDTPECGDLDVGTAMSIVGAGTLESSITNTTDPAPSFTTAYESRVIDVHMAALELHALSLRRGIGQGSASIDVPGGCLHASQADVLLEKVAIADCRSHFVGGAVHLQQSLAKFDQVTLTDSWASGGGGLALAGGSTVHGTQVQIGNNAAFWGGGVVALGGTNTLRLAALSTISGNSVTPDYGDRRGGGLLVTGGTLVVDSDDDAAPNWLRIEGNAAGVDGGGASVAPNSVLELSQARVIGNVAQAEGGGLHVRGRLQLRDAEVASNLAGSHGGGASLLSDGLPASRIERAGFHANAAGGNGGAIAVASPRAWIENVSSHANVATGTGGGFHIASQPHAFRHNTSFGDLGQGGSALHAASPLLVKGNVFGGRCTGSGTVTNLGYNARASTASGCVGSSFTAAQMGLAYGSWGGPFDLVGFPPASLLAGMLPAAAAPPALDARGYLRPGPGYDPGAYEHDAH